MLISSEIKSGKNRLEYFINMKKVFEKIDSLNSSFIDIWEDVCNIESPSSYKKGVDQVGKYFINIANENGWDVEVFKQETAGDVVCITMNSQSLNEVITISGHMDTVHPVGLFGSPATRRDDEKIYGPGAMDCKGGIVAGFLAMKALYECNFKDRPVRMLLQSNEEIGSGLENKATINYICEKAKDSIAFLNLEGHESFFEGKACLKRKGIAGFLFTVTGIETHASYCADEGASAILEAAHKIIELEKIKNSEGLTFNCGIINGGTASNTVPGKCEFKLDVRFSSNAEYEEACKLINKIANTVYVEGCSCTVKETNRRVAMELNDKNISLLNKANHIFIENELSPLEIGERRGGSDASDVSNYGIACIDSIGVGGERAHSKEEYGVLNSLAESAKRIASIICGI